MELLAIFWKKSRSYGSVSENLDVFTIQIKNAKNSPKSRMSAEKIRTLGNECHQKSKLKVHLLDKIEELSVPQSSGSQPKHKKGFSDQDTAA